MNDKIIGYIIEGLTKDLAPEARVKFEKAKAEVALITIKNNRELKDIGTLALVSMAHSLLKGGGGNTAPDLSKFKFDGEVN